MKIYSYVVTKNEADRYLKDCLTSLKEQVDGVCVYDDQSDDDTVDVLRDLNIPHVIRSNIAPSFMEDESVFRQQAWNLMEALFSPKYGDWILTLDADEFLRINGSLHGICDEATELTYDALWMHVHEMWGPDQIRIDGYWPTIEALRLVSYRPNGKFLPRKQGGGSIPSYPANVFRTNLADILHYGYFNPDDRMPKYQRYSDTVGHSSQHINSIIEQPMLAQLPDLI